MIARKLHEAPPMERFIRRQNVEQYLQLLATTTDEGGRWRIMKLLTEERQKQRDVGDDAETAAPPTPSV
jgi:hypothetical protein